MSSPSFAKEPCEAAPSDTSLALCDIMFILARTCQTRGCRGRLRKQGMHASRVDDEERAEVRVREGSMRGDVVRDESWWVRRFR